jgi:hypothetical protein
LIKRLELEHIEEVIDSLCVLPDFGYPGMLLDTDFKGWDHFRDLIQYGGKYERVINYIEA